MTPFRRLWLAQTVSVLGDLLAVFAVQVAVVFRMHGGARDMAGVFVAALIPSVLLGPVAGVFADRWDPRRRMIVSDLGRGVLILMLMRATSLPQIYAISLAVSCFSSFFAPAQAITIPLLVPRAGLLAANARMQQSMQVARMVSPALAAALVAAFGERICYAADSVSFFLSAGMLATLRCTRPARLATARRVLYELRAGAHFLFTDSQFTFAALALTAGTFAAGCFSALASVYVRDMLHRGPAVLGMIGSLIAVGTVAGAAGLSSPGWSKWGDGSDPRRLMGVGMAGIGASVLLIAIVPAEITALAGSAGMGLSVAVVMLAANVMLQGEAPPELRGRLSGILSSLTSLAQLAALLLAGVWAARLGIRGVFLLSAALLLATSIGAFLGERNAQSRGFRAERNRSRPRKSKCAGGSQSGRGDS